MLKSGTNKTRNLTTKRWYNVNDKNLETLTKDTRKTCTHKQLEIEHTVLDGCVIFRAPSRRRRLHKPQAAVEFYQPRRKKCRAQGLYAQYAAASRSDFARHGLCQLWTLK